MSSQQSIISSLSDVNSATDWRTSSEGIFSRLSEILTTNIENVLKNKDFKARGEKIFNDGGLELGPFSTVSFAFDWTIDPFNNRTWKWRLHWLSFISYMIASVNSENASERLSQIATNIESWVTYATSVDADNEFVWHDHGTALRAEQISIFLAFTYRDYPVWFENHIVPNIQYWKSLLDLHGTKLEDHEFYSKHTNHGLEQVRVLLLLGYGLDEKEWLKTATSRLEDELSYSFGRDGVHVENSPAYHVFVLKIFINTIKQYSADILGKTLQEKFTNIGETALAYLANILRPDGLLPNFGDTESLPVTDGFRAMFGKTQAYQWFLYSFTRGVRGKPYPSSSAYFKNSGWAILRDKWSAAKNFRSTLHLVFKAGSVSSYHRQEDDGSITLMFGTEDWLIDSGMYNYNKSDPLRKYVRSRVAHNVLQLIGAEQSATWQQLDKKWTLDGKDYVVEGSASAEIEAKLDVYKNVAQTRKILFTNLETKVFDSFSSNDNKAYHAVCLWHVPIDKNITIVDGNTIHLTSKSGTVMAMSLNSDHPITIRKFKGNEHRVWASHVSKKFNQIDISQVLVIDAGRVPAWNIETKINFTNL